MRPKRSSALEVSLLAYTAYLGHTQLGHAVPQSLPAGAARERYLDGVIDTLVHPARPPEKEKEPN
ncbi:hypothetical protein ACH4VT_14020 [Streptomyces lydicus]|uniref:hypothetical protein n=1 Tax=Streptomyces lydicus TaxID=47763 RepID=UPI0037916CA2